MPEKNVGKVLVEAKVENSGDVWMAKRGTLEDSKVRSVVIPDALVDTGATLLSLPPSLIAALGLDKVSEKRIKTAGGPRIANLYSPVRLTILDRSCTMDVMDVPEGIPSLIGYIPLEHLDLVVDPKAQTVIGNPANDGVHTYDMY